VLWDGDRHVEFHDGSWWETGAAAWVEM